MMLEHDQPACTISISQEAFIDTLLQRFGLINANPITTPLLPGLCLSSSDSLAPDQQCAEMASKPHHKLIGALQWLALGTCPDIAFAATSLTHFGHDPGLTHWDMARHVLHYLKGMKRMHLMLGGTTASISGYTDADWGSDQDDCHSIGAYVFKIGSSSISWKSKKQSCVTLSSTEAE